MKRRVLVTGGAGFIGSHVVDALISAGDEVHVLDDLSKGMVTNLPDDVRLHVSDIADVSVSRLFRDVRFDAVVHCAAQTNVMRSISEPDLDRHINVDGLQRVLDAAADTGVRRFVFISSGGAVYGETAEPANELTAPQPDNPYGEHKLQGEAMVAAAAALASVTLRLSNVYGTRQRSDAEGGVVSIFTDRLAAGLSIGVYGDGEQCRDFVHVADVVSAIILALNDDSMRGTWNVGTGTATTVNEVARAMLVAFGGGTIERLPARGEIRRSCLDVSKLIATGRWQPSRDFATGVGELAALVRAARTA